MSGQVEVPPCVTRSMQDFRQEFSMGEYIEYTGTQMGATKQVRGWHSMKPVPKRGWIVGISLDLWGRNTYRIHWEDMPDVAFASEDIDPDDLKPVDAGVPKGGTPL